METTATRSTSCAAPPQCPICHKVQRLSPFVPKQTHRVHGASCEQCGCRLEAFPSSIGATFHESKKQHRTSLPRVLLAPLLFAPKPKPLLMAPTESQQHKEEDNDQVNDSAAHQANVHGWYWGRQRKPYSVLKRAPIQDKQVLEALPLDQLQHKLLLDPIADSLATTGAVLFRETPLQWNPLLAVPSPSNSLMTGYSPRRVPSQALLEAQEVLLLAEIATDQRCLRAIRQRFNSQGLLYEFNAQTRHEQAVLERKLSDLEQKLSQLRAQQQKT